MKIAFKLLTIMFFLSSISLAEDPEVYTDQDLNKYKSPEDDTNRQIYLREKKRQELDIKIDRSQRINEIIQEMQITISQDISDAEVCYKLKNLQKEIDKLIMDDKEEQAKAAGIKLSIKRLCDN